MASSSVAAASQFGDTDEHATPVQRFHGEICVAPDVAEGRVAAAGIVEQPRRWA